MPRSDYRRGGEGGGRSLAGAVGDTSWTELARSRVGLATGPGPSHHAASFRTASIEPTRPWCASEITSCTPARPRARNEQSNVVHPTGDVRTSWLEGRPALRHPQAPAAGRGTRLRDRVGTHPPSARRLRSSRRGPRYMGRGGEGPRRLSHQRRRPSHRTSGRCNRLVHRARSRPRAPPAREEVASLAPTDRRPPSHRREQQSRRNREPHHQAGQAIRPRVLELRELPPPDLALRWSHPRGSTRTPLPGTSTGLLVLRVPTRGRLPSLSSLLAWLRLRFQGQEPPRNPGWFSRAERRVP